MISEVARSLSVPLPSHVIASLDLRFYAVSVPVVLVTQKKTIRGEILHLSLPLMRVLSAEELRAVVAHELAHFKGADTLWTVRFAPVYLALKDLSERLLQLTGWRLLAAIPAGTMLTLYALQFAPAERIYRRRRELEADRLSASVVGATAIASALAMLLAAQPVGRALVRALSDQKLDEGQSHNLCRFFAFWTADHLAKQQPTKILEAIARARLPHPVDTHPPLRDRLVALGVDPSGDTAWLKLADQPASSLIDGIEEIELGASRREVEFYSEVFNRPLHLASMRPRLSEA
jgi:Zn-dependent protease with chaperone function